MTERKRDLVPSAPGTRQAEVSPVPAQGRVHCAETTPLPARLLFHMVSPEDQHFLFMLPIFSHKVGPSKGSSTYGLNAMISIASLTELTWNYANSRKSDLLNA